MPNNEIIYVNVNPEEEQGYYWMDYAILLSNGLVEWHEEGLPSLGQAIASMNIFRATKL